MFRPIGGWLADRVGGARVTLWNFVAMTGLALGALAFLPEGGAPGRFDPFLATFVLLFAATGIGNGSTYRMIPAIFATLHRAPEGAGVLAVAAAKRSPATESAAVAEFRLGHRRAYGAFFVPKAFRDLARPHRRSGGRRSSASSRTTPSPSRLPPGQYARKGSRFTC